MGVGWTRNERGALAGLKTTSYAENVVALARAHEAGATEAMFANTRGELCEGTGTNVFVGVDGLLVTPPLDSGCLDGDPDGPADATRERGRDTWRNGTTDAGTGRLQTRPSWCRRGGRSSRSARSTGGPCRTLPVRSRSSHGRLGRDLRP